jgi:hypothetical protein
MRKTSPLTEPGAEAETTIQIDLEPAIPGSANEDPGKSLHNLSIDALGAAIDSIAASRGKDGGFHTVAILVVGPDGQFEVRGNVDQDRLIAVWARAMNALVK